MKIVRDEARPLEGNQKITLTISQLKRFIKESSDIDIFKENGRDEYDEVVRCIRRSNEEYGERGTAKLLIDAFGYQQVIDTLTGGNLTEESEDEYQVTDANNPLTGKSRQSAQRFIYKVIGDHKGMFRDDNWKHIHEIFNRMRAAGVDVSYGPINDRTHSGGYFRNERGQVAGKEWEFTIEFVNNNDRECTITGRVIASFGGTVDQAENDDIGPDRPYDIVVTMY